MKTHAGRANLLALLSLLVVMLVSGLAACGEAAAAQPRLTAPPPSALSVATRYFQLFNAGMRSGDFSALASVYAPDATLTQSSPQGVTTVVHGLANIIRFDQGVKTRLAGCQWTTESIGSLAPNVVLAYEHACSPPLRVAGRCIHVFDIQNGKIVSYEWATYYAGQP